MSVNNVTFVGTLVVNVVSKCIGLMFFERILIELEVIGGGRFSFVFWI